MEYVFVKPADILGMFNREKERHRVLMSGIEVLAFAHPHKKFYFRVEKFYYDKLRNNPDEAYTFKLDVYDYGVCVGSLSTYKPDGNERDKVQVEFKYDYNVHQKEPKNLKRSSDWRKIIEFGKMFRPVDVDNPRTHVKMFHNLTERVADVTMLRNRTRGLKNTIDRITYGKDSEKLLYDLVNNQVSVEADKFKSEFMVQWREAEAARQDYQRQTDRIVVIVPTPHNEFLLTRFQIKEGKTQRDEITAYNAQGKVYADRSALPEDVTGKLAVLEISSDDTADVKIDGVGIFERDANRVIIIGEDLYGIDPGTQSQNAGSESS